MQIIILLQNANVVKAAELLEFKLHDLHVKSEYCGKGYLMYLVYTDIWMMNSIQKCPNLP